MDTRTGEIGTYEELRKKGAKPSDLILIDEGALKGVEQMNRHERRAWAVKQRREMQRARKARTTAGAEMSK